MTVPLRGESLSLPVPAGRPLRPGVLAGWCVWLLVWLAPGLLLPPAAGAAWAGPQDATWAVLAGAAVFFVIAWPFWFASGGPEERGGRAWARHLVWSSVEAVCLWLLAVPFLVAAWAAGGRGPVLGPTLATVAGLTVLGLGFRLAAVGLGPGAGRRLMAAALVVCGGPAAVAYALGETLGPGFAWLAEASPAVGLVCSALEGWPTGPWATAVRLWFWPAVGVGLAVLGGLAAQRKAAGCAGAEISEPAERDTGG